MIETPQRALRSFRDCQSPRQLVNLIASGDRAAFRRLYTTFARRVRRSAMLALPPLHAQAVTSATFLEVWYLAAHYVNQPPAQVRVWFTAVAARRISERVRTLNTPHMLLDDYDRHVECELADLLNPARPGAADGGYARRN
jgi:RNA polymerase sigma-70 factor, ECF subfamily